MSGVFKAVSAYWLLGLASGFGFGTLRELVLTPAFGPALATAVELPLILLVLWFGCGAILRWARVKAFGRRAMVGGLWLVAFLVTEFALGSLLRGWSPADTLAHFSTPQGALGLGGFVFAALFPVLRRS